MPRSDQARGTPGTGAAGTRREPLSVARPPPGAPSRLISIVAGTSSAANAG